MSPFDVGGLIARTGISPWAALLTAATLAACCLSYLALLPRPLPDIPYDRASARSVWGDVLKLRGDPGGLARWSSRQLERHGAPICQALLGPLSPPVVLVADLPEVRDAFARSGDYDRSAYIVDRFPLLGAFHLNMPTGEGWRTSRGWLKDLLDRPHMQEVVGPSVHASMGRLVELWEAKGRLAGGRPFSMVDDLKELALDTIMAFHFGDDFADSALGRQVEFTRELDEGDVEIGKHGEASFPRAPLHDFQQALTYLGDRITAIYATKWPVAVVSWWLRWGTPYCRALFRYKDEFIRKSIDLGVKRSLENEGPKSGVDMMVLREQKAARKQNRPSVLGKNIFIDETWGNLVAGQHTTSAALVWILKLLADHPSAQRRLHDELRVALGDGAAAADREGGRSGPTCAEIVAARLPYLDAVVEETLRLRAGMIVPRDAVRDTTLLGRRVPRGAVVLMILQGPDFNAKPATPYWRDVKDQRGASRAGAGGGGGGGDPDLGAFDPERWLVRGGGEGEDGGQQKVEFDGSRNPQLAFGIGIRACWGRRLAMLETRIMTAMAVWKFEFLPVPEPLASHEATYDISYRAKQGFVKIRSR